MAALVPARRGPKGASKLTPEVTGRIARLHAEGKALRQIGDVGRDGAPDAGDEAAAGGQEPLPVLPDPVRRDRERALARWGLLLALPALEATGLLDAARGVYGRLKNGYYGLAATLLTLVFLALAGEPRAEGATRVPPGALGRVLGLDRAPEVKTIRRKLGELAAVGKAADLVMALARRHAAAGADALGFLHVVGHARGYYGTRDVQKTHVARLKFPRTRHHGDLGHRSARGSGVHGGRRAVGVPGPGPPAVIATERYHRGLEPLLIATGGVNRHTGIVEGREFARQLTTAGVPEHVIRVEDQSADTWQNVERSLPYLREALAAGLRLTVVSRWYHRRAVHALRTLLPEAGYFYAIS